MIEVSTDTAGHSIDRKTALRFGSLAILLSAGVVLSDLALLLGSYDTPPAAHVALYIDIAVLVFLMPAIRGVRRQTEGAWATLGLVWAASAAMAVFVFGAVLFQTSSFSVVGGDAAALADISANGMSPTICYINLGLRFAVLLLIGVNAAYDAFSHPSGSKPDEVAEAPDMSAQQRKLDMARDAGLISSDSHKVKSTQAGRAATEGA